MKFKESEVGRIPGHWELKPLTDLISNIVDNRGKSAPTSNEGIALIATNCIKENGLYPTKEKIRFVSEETYGTWFRGHPKPGDIIIVNKGTPGLVCLVPKKVDFCIAQDMVALSPDENSTYGKYLFTAMRSHKFKFQVDSLNVGTTIPHLKKTVFSKLLIPIPPIEEQIIIGDIYCSLSEKIELNRQMNATLEAIGQAIFKHWFVDFEFPNEEGKPYKSSGGEMEETELGEVPIGWRVEEIGNIVKVVGGGTPSTKNPAFWEGGMHCWTTPKDLSGISSPVILDTAKKVTDAGLAKISSGLLPKGTFLLSSRAPVGYTAIAQVPIAVNQGYIAIPPSEQLSTLFLLYWTRENLETIEGRACGTTFQEISKKNFKPIRLTMPLPKILVKFDKTVGYLFERIVVNERESRTLTNIRDALLPKLMSGEIRVK